MWNPIIVDLECIVCNKSLQKINHDPREASRNMGKITNRRSRTPNWSLQEKQHLLELIRERKEVVVTKTTNGPNHYVEKDEAWNEILRALAARFGNKFCGSSIKKVKTQWQNMKRIAREEITLNGPEVQKYTRQSFEVCSILDLVKDGVLKKEGENINVTDSSIISNIEVKAERIDDEINQPSCSGPNNFMEIDQLQNSSAFNNDSSQRSNQFESSSSSLSEQISEPTDIETPEEVPLNRYISKKNVSANTDASYFEELRTVNPLQRDLQEFFRYTSAEKQLKIESLKEERHVMRAVRETAELNKIIAEQKLKHVLWMKKQDMAMYSGEPGSGAGKGGGGGGAIREAGGAFGKMEAAREDEYFFKKQREQLQNLKGHLNKEISFHEDQIRRHEDAIRRHKQQMTEMDTKDK